MVVQKELELGGPGWAIKCETNADKQVSKEVLINGSCRKNTGGSQFYLFVPCPHLDNHHTVFGEIEENDDSALRCSLNKIDK